MEGQENYGSNPARPKANTNEDSSSLLPHPGNFQGLVSVKALGGQKA